MHRGTQQKSARPSLCSPAVDGVGIHHGIFQLVFALLCIKQRVALCAQSTMNATEAGSPYPMLSSNQTGSGYITETFPQNVDGYHLDQHPCQKISWAPCPTPIQTKVINLYLNRNLFLVYLYVKNTLTSLSLSLSCIIQP